MRVNFYLDADLGARASQIGTEHDDPWGLVVVGSILLKAVFEKFDVTTTAVTTALEFDFILHNESLSRWVQSLGEWS